MVDYKKLIENYKTEMLEKLKNLLKIPSIYDRQTISTQKPFGDNVDKALKYIGALGQELGFEVDYCDGYATELTIGNGQTLIGIFAHTDVVPISGDWISPPFCPQVRDNKLYARGASDDKGPLISALYATKALWDANLLNDCRVRIVVGGDEERNSECLKYYFETLKKESPTYGFTPDSDFPLIYGEKGIQDFVASFDIDIPFVKSISGGVVSNAVCDKATVCMDCDDKFLEYLDNSNIQYSLTDEGIEFFGKTSHGSTPELGINAGFIALKVLGDYFHIDKLSYIAQNLSDTTGKAFNGYSKSDLLGETSYCVGLLSYKNGKLDITVNFRYNEKVNPEEYVQIFDKFFCSKSIVSKESRCLFYDPNCELVQTLLNTYREETNDMTEPLTSGGGTYAKHAPNTIAFGALFPNAEYTMHEPNEYIDLKDFYKASEIYAHAIYNLSKLKK